MPPSPSAPVLCSPWATVDDLSTRQRDELEADGIDVDAEMPAALEIASEILWMLSGRLWLGGGCEEEVTLRSGQDANWPFHSTWGQCGCWAYGTYIDGRWFPGAYPHAHVAVPVAVKLPRTPVTEVVSVEVGGEPFAAWALSRSGWLERTDGRGWQVCDYNTVVTYRFGEPPPAAGIAAAVEFALEIARARAGSDTCRLPPNTVSLTRQGVSLELEASDARDMRTGLHLVDLWLDAVNPSKRSQGGRVWSPDLPSTRFSRSLTP